MHAKKPSFFTIIKDMEQQPTVIDIVRRIQADELFNPIQPEQNGIAMQI